MNLSPPYIILDDQITPSLRVYENPIDIVKVETLEDIPDGLAQLQAHYEAGRYIAGYLSYELGYALEDRLALLMPDTRPVPLLAFGVFESVTFDEHNFAAPEPFPPIALEPAWTQADYETRFNQVQDYLIAGDVYQINLTFPMTGTSAASALDIYTSLRGRQPGKYGGIVSLGGPEIISLSPELFFRKTVQSMQMRPMKGTIKRGTDEVNDQAAASFMQADIKSQAENLMIVDLLRNDLSRISEPGTVKVPELYALETYPTLHQMTSQVHSTLRDKIDFETIVRNLFPSGSITGAPKVRAMEIINELEDTPRGAYCGSVGYIDPNGDACFSVAIRTLTLENGSLTYNVGSGVVLDSRAEDEYAECLLKAKILEPSGPELIETLRWSPARKFVRRDRHLARLERSANALNYPYDPEAVIATLKESIRTASMRQRVRLTLSDTGTVKITTEDYFAPSDPWTLSLSKNPLSPDVQMTAHKTSARDFYDGERSRIRDITGCDEVLFFNEDDELCEGSITSVFVEKDGIMRTPALSCGLLPGVLRESLLNSGKVEEAILTLGDLEAADFIMVGNSLRGLLAARMIAFDRV